MFCLLILLWAGFSRGQDNVVKDVIHPAPNAASLGKYGDIPVSYHTGIPNIQVPIFTVQEGSLSLPISLSYHASGVRVEETASWVGLGWALNAGGVITRTVRNAPDEDGKLQQKSGYWADYGYDFYQGSSEVQNLTFAASGAIDTEPDLFSFNVNGYAGKFFFDDNRNVVLMPRQDIKIEVIASQNAYGYQFDQWVMTTPDGVKYTFGGTDAIEESASSSGYVFSNELFNRSSWYLKQIESPNGDFKIELEYEAEKYAYYNNASESKVGAATECPAPQNAPNPVKTIVKGVRLSRIQTPYTTVDFVANHIRQDLSKYIAGTTSGINNESKALDEILIKDREGDCIKRFIFNKSYFVSTYNPVSLNFDPDQSDKKRLRLNSVQETSCSGKSSLPPHAFSYHEQFGISRRRSFAQDHWGYYNGQPNNMLTPRRIATTGPSCTRGAVRTPNASRMKEWSLSQIKYPLGGWTSFEYEPHAVNSYNFGQGPASMVGGLRLKKMTHNDGDGDASNNMIQEFNYVNANGSSSGKLMSEVLYGSPLEVGIGSGSGSTSGSGGTSSNGYPMAMVVCPNSSNVPYLFGGKSVAPMHSVQGSHIGYTRVEVSRPGNGKSIYAYVLNPYFASNTNFPYTDAPFTPSNGKMMLEQHFDQNGVMRSEKQYSYTQNIDNISVAHVPFQNLYNYPGVLKIQAVDVSNVCNNPQYPVGTVHARKTYPLQTGTNNLSKLRERTYDANGLSFKEKTTRYEYGSNNHYQLTKEYFTNSDGKVISTEYHYAHELNDNALINKNMLAIPLETLQKVDGQLVGGVKTEYANFGSDVLLKHFYKKLRDGSNYLQATIDEYEGEGSMRQFHQNGNVPNAYLWDAGEQLPIAKVINAQWNEIAYTGFEDEGQSTSQNGRFLIEGLAGGYSSDAKTGQQSLSLYQSGSWTYRRLRHNINKSGTYVISFWYKGATLQLKNGSTTLETLSPSSAWHYVEMTASLNAGNQIRLQSINGGMVKIDEVRIHPVDAQMTTYSYDGARRLVDISDLNSRSTTYDYDAFGRLASVRDQDGNIVQTHDYTISAQVATNPSALRSAIVRVAGKTTLGQVNAMIDPREKHANVSYFDGLGRTTQEIALKATPDQKNWVTPHQYNALGQESRQFLAFRSALNNSNYIVGGSSLQANFYNTHAELASMPQADRMTPFADTRFEASPLMRVIEQGSAGADWQIQSNGNGHTLKTLYRTNDPNLSIDKVRRWLWSASTDQFSGATIYPAGTLDVVETINENGSRSLTYTDLMERIVLQRSQIDNSSTTSKAEKWANTYYLYDDFGNLRHVIQPEGSKALNSNGWNLYGGNILEEFVFSYEYDNRHRMSKKRIPGADWEYQVYDKLDRLVLSQDGNLRGSKKWRFTKYDMIGRPVQTGLHFGGTAQLDALQSMANNASQIYEAPDNSAYGYTNQAFPVLSNYNPEIYSISFFDDYDFNRNGTDQDPNEVSTGESFLGNDFTGSSFDALRNDYTRGLITGVKVRVLDASNQFLLTRTYYDRYGRELQTRADNHLGGQDRITYDYNFASELKRSVHFHQTPAEVIHIYKAFEYDHQGRLLKVWQDLQKGFTLQWTPNPILLVSQTYDVRGQLKSKKLHSTNQGANFLQSLDYLYNIRGWMRKINEIHNCGDDEPEFTQAEGLGEPGEPILGTGGEPTGEVPENDLFAMELRYNRLTNDLPTSVPALYNGNIAGMIWQTDGGVTCDPQAYSFTYDAMDRLQSAQYAERTVSNNWSQHADRYSLESIQYDQNGNILNLQRKGVTTFNAANGTFSFGIMDDLSYTYRGNRLIRLEDNVIDNLPISVERFRDRTKTFQAFNFNTHEYRYDANGNITSDYNKGVSVSYNSFNKPVLVTFTDANDSRFGQQLRYVYTGDGTKIRQEVLKANGQIEKQTDYVGGFQYEAQANSNGSLGSRAMKFFAHEEGRVRLNGNQLELEYFLKDHLGNTRVTFGDPDNNGIANLLQEDHYYPFGMKHSGSFVQATPVNQYRYNGKEFQDELSLGWYDYGARMYDASIGRWNGVDALAEEYLGWAPFNYVLGNPVIFIDPDGRSVLNGDTTVYFLDSGERPPDDGTDENTYQGDVYVVVDGTVVGTYRGSTYPNSISNSNNSTNHNTVKEGTYPFNNASGHKGGTQKGLNIVNENGERETSGISPTGNELTMTLVNAHSGYSENGNYNSRGSHGCPTIHPDDADAFFDNFSWNGNTGTSSGNMVIARGENAQQIKNQLTNPSSASNTAEATSEQAGNSNNTQQENNIP